MRNTTEVEFLYLTQAEVVETGVDMHVAIEAVEAVLRLHHEGNIVLPYKVVLDLDERERGRIMAMPAYVGGDIDLCGIKWISGFPKNPVEHNLPRGIGLLVLNNSQNGVPVAIMDATYISALRTGAVTGVAAKYLARSDSTTVAMIGAGVQARTQLAALRCVLPELSFVRVYDIRAESAQCYSKEVSEQFGLEVRPVERAEDAVVGADIIVTITTADEPIVKAAWVGEGTFFSHAGSYQEEEEQVVLDSHKIVVDDWVQVRHRGTSILGRMYSQGLLDDSDIYASLGELVSGERPGRESRDERIFFAPIGMGIEDVAVGYQVYQRALDAKLGTRLRLFGYQ